MANSENLVVLIGNVGKAVEMRYSPSGNPVSTFSLATNRKYTDGSGQVKEETDWHNITVWGKPAEFCNQYVQKGSTVYVQGRIHYRSWDGQDGQKHYRTEIIANKVSLFDKKPINNDKVESQEEPQGDIEPNDIPF